MRKLKSGGGWQAIRYTLRKAEEVGPITFWRAMRAKNACKTCAFGMGGQLGGMTNEAGHFPEVCKKSVQAMASDMQGRIEPRFFSTYSLDELRRFSPRELEFMGRLVDPVVAAPGDTHYRVVSWETAFELIAKSLKSTQPERTSFYSSGRSSNEAGFLMQLFARAYGTNHVSNCSFYCHQASGVGLNDSIGTSTATVALEDVENCDLLFVIGGNPPSNHPRLMTTMMKLRRRGGQIIVVNPVKETGLVNFKVPSSPASMLFGTEIASMYLQPTIGGDIALLAGIGKWLIERNQIDAPFIENATDGFEAVASYLAGLSWDEIVKSSGVPRAEIERAAEAYARSERTVFSWTMGITHHEHGVQNVQWIVNLALLRGMIGKPGAGVMPIRGHSNVQGLGSVGVTPAVGKAVLARLEAEGLTPPAWKGHDTMGVIEAAGRGEMDFLFCLGGNLYGANPDASFASRAFGEIDTVVYLNTTLNTTHVSGRGKTTLILPVLARDEESQSTTQESMFSFVRLSDGGPRRHEGPKSEVDIVAEMAHRTLGRTGPIVWADLRNHDEIRRLIARVVPGLEQVEGMGQSKQEFQIPGRRVDKPKFKTESGKAAFHAHPLPAPPPLGPRQVRVMTARSEGQFNSVVYEEKDIYRHQERRDVILLNPRDIARFGLAVDQRITVSSEAGSMPNILVREFDIAEGCGLMYYPEANILVPRTIDPRSRTPAFKSVTVTLSDGSGSAENSAPIVSEPVLAHAEASRASLRAC